MKLLIENCDFFEDGLTDVMGILYELIHKEDRNFDDVKRVRNILDDLDSFNITFLLEDVDTAVYTMLLSMKNISAVLVNNNAISFKQLNFPDNETEEEYVRLITQYINLLFTLKERYHMSDKELEYLEPNSKLVSIRVSVSIKDLFYFILTCSKYDELMDILLAFSNYDELMELMVTISLSLTEVIHADDLFIRLKLEEEYRKTLLDSSRVNINIISNEDYIDYCMSVNNNEVKLSTIGLCSLVAYREIVNNTPKQDIKVENFNDFIEQEYFNVTLPVKYMEVDPDLANIIDQYIYDWYLLIDKLRKFEGLESEQFLCCLGCFEHIFRMNTPIYNYFELDAEGMTEVEELMNIVQSKLLH